jgi:hypothetical protein
MYQKEKPIGDEKKDSCEQEEGESHVVFKFQKIASKEYKTFYERIGFAYKFESDSFQTWTKRILQCLVLSV